MFRKLFLLLAIAAFTLVATTAFGVVWRYYGDCHPMQAGSAGYWDGVEYHFALYEGTGEMLTEVVDDPDAWDGKALHILDDTAADKIKWRVQPSVNIDGSTGATAIARMKTISESSGGACFGILEGGGLQATPHWGGPTGHLKDADRGGDINLTGDTNYHIIRVTSIGTTSSTLPYNEPFTYANGNLNGNGGFSGNAGSEIAIDNNTVKITGGAGGTNATHGFDVSTDSEGYITVNIKVMAGAINPLDPTQDPTFSWEFHCKDTGGGDLGYWYGKHNTARPRLGGTVLDEQTLTGGWDTLQIKIRPGFNTTEFIFNGTSLGVVDHGAIGNKLGSIEFTRKDNTDAAGDTIFFDDIEVLGNIATRTVKIYWDEDPTPVITISPAANVSGGVDSLMIGSGSTGGMEDLYFDWAYMTTDGAFAPGEEIGKLGFSLVPQQTPVTTIGGALTAPENAQVKLTNAVVTCPILASDYIGFAQPMSFGLQDATPLAGVRVMSDFPVYQGQKVTVLGTMGKFEGERVMFASAVSESDYPTDPLPPVGMNNKSTAGKEAVANRLAVSNNPVYREDFSYGDGVLNCKDGWTGDAGAEIAVDTATLKILGGCDTHTLTKTLAATDLGTGVISISAKVKKGLGGNTFWSLYIDDAVGANLARFYGTGESGRGRIGATASVTPAQTFTGGWDTVKIDIDVTTDQSKFFFNGVDIGTLSHAGAGNSIGRIRFERVDAPSEGQYIWLDDLEVRPSPVMSGGAGNVGLYSRIYGKVTAVYEDSMNPWEGYFYVDDGSGLKDGSGFTGIKCRPGCEFALHNLPVMDEYIWVSGLVGIREIDGVPTRYFWTWNWTTSY